LIASRYGGAITNQLRRLGASCDWTRERFTLDDQLSRAVMEAFVHLHEKGLVYRGSYMVNWSPNLQTAVSDLEVEYSEEPGKLYYFKYHVAGGTSDDYLPVATTRPETVLGDTAVAVHPQDERYAKYVGKMAVVPLSEGRQIPIIADEYVEREFGTGALKITPGHDPNDYAIGKKLDLPIINIMNNDGTLNDRAGVYWYTLLP
jgi:valyl-tRNA synthetase